MHYTTGILAAALLSIPRAYAQIADGLLVPFTTGLPACASQCGPFSDVQGGCVPPVKPQPDQSCFCGDARLSAIRTQGTAGVSSVCGPASCTSASDLEAVRNWYLGFCESSVGSSPTTTARGGSATNTGSSNSGSSNGNSSGSGGSGGGGGGGGGVGGGSWAQTHTKWLIMAVVIVVGIAALWAGAWFFRRRHLRKKEREIEMSPPVAWGPHQMHGAAHADGVSHPGAVAAGAAGGHHKEFAARDSTVEGKRLTKGQMGWFKANRDA